MGVDEIDDRRVLRWTLVLINPQDADRVGFHPQSESDPVFPVHQGDGIPDAHIAHEVPGYGGQVQCLAQARDNGWKLSGDGRLAYGKASGVYDDIHHFAGHAYSAAGLFLWLTHFNTPLLSSLKIKKGSETSCKLFRSPNWRRFCCAPYLLYFVMIYKKAQYAHGMGYCARIVNAIRQQRSRQPENPMKDSKKHCNHII